MVRLIGEYDHAACCLALALLCNVAALMADTASASETDFGIITPETVVMLAETEDAQCLVNDGKLILLQLKDSSRQWEVWIDRWFMQVQTADHTKHVLGPDLLEVALGCSRSNAGPQHWTIHHVK